MLLAALETPYPTQGRITSTGSTSTTSTVRRTSGRTEEGGTGLVLNNQTAERSPAASRSTMTAARKARLRRFWLEFIRDS